MCTAISFNGNNHYFGRNLDYEHDFGEKIVITPRNFVLKFQNGEVIKNHFAIIGMAVIADNYPLYFDGTNEAGLSMAGLNFPGNAHYCEPINGKNNVASFELIPFVLAKCKNVKQAIDLFKNINITNIAFSSLMTPSPLHWIISDKTQSITVEQTQKGLNVFDNPVGVLTNNPTFDFHLTNLSNYLNVTAQEPQNRFSEKINLKPYSRGMGGIGIPGDLSSSSRFVRASFVKLNSPCPVTDTESVAMFFHILYSVYQQKGCVKLGSDFEITNYTSCCNTDKGIYYYTTYNNHSISAVDMHKENLDECYLYEFEIKRKQKIDFLN